MQDEDGKKKGKVMAKSELKKVINRHMSKLSDLNKKLKKAKEEKPHLHRESPKKKSTPIHMWKEQAKKLGEGKVKDDQSKAAILKALGVNPKDFKGSLKDLLKIIKDKKEEVASKKKAAQRKVTLRKRQMERRIDPNDGKPRTLSEFTTFYRSTIEWEAADPELRVDPNDGVGRTRAEFREHYSTDYQWNHAKVRSQIAWSDFIWQSLLKFY